MPESTPCYPGALAGAFHGPLALSQMVNYGCEGSWAFVWATIGRGARAIGVTEVLYFNRHGSDWRFVQRAVVCSDATLPARIEAKGCHSN